MFSKNSFTFSLVNSMNVLVQCPVFDTALGFPVCTISSFSLQSMILSNCVVVDLPRRQALWLRNILLGTSTPWTVCTRPLLLSWSIYVVHVLCSKLGDRPVVIECALSPTRLDLKRNEKNQLICVKFSISMCLPFSRCRWHSTSCSLLPWPYWHSDLPAWASKNTCGFWKCVHWSARFFCGWAHSFQAKGLSLTKIMNFWLLETGAILTILKTNHKKPSAIGGGQVVSISASGQLSSGFLH